MNPRSLVGMTQGARKRAALYESLFNQDTSHIKMTNKQLRMVWRNVWPLSGWARSEREQVRKSYRIGQRLRPCPGCSKCGAQARRFAPTAGWKSPRTWILWDGSQLWMIARTWRRLCTMPTLADYTSGVEDGTWRELFCDGSGVLPAKKAKVK